MMRVHDHRMPKDGTGSRERGLSCALKLIRNEIVYDVDYTSWKVAQCRISDEISRSEAQTDEENSDWLTRQVETAIENAKARISVYVVDMARMQTDEDEHKEEWNIVLYMEPGWRGNVKVMNTYMHRFVTDFVLSEWFKMTMPDEAGVYAVSADEWLDQIVNEARKVVVKNVIFRL